MPQFIPGLELNRQFYQEVVQPILDSEFPGLAHAAALLGPGSEVLGYDTVMSTDHDWGPRLQLFLSEDNFRNYQTAVHERLQALLPRVFYGYSTHFAEPDDEGTRCLAETDGPVNHRIEIWTVRAFFESYMAFDPRLEPTVLDWLVWPQQHLLGVTAGAVYADNDGELEAIRRKLSYYPHDVWLYLLMSQWRRIGQEEHFVGRTGDLNDELGSMLLASRLVHDLMQLCFFMEKVYAPYPKWFGTAFNHLSCAQDLRPTLEKILLAGNWRLREGYLNQAYEFVARKHNDLGLTRSLAPVVRYFHDRPFLIIDADRFVSALKVEITDPEVQGIAEPLGSIDQFSHCTDLRSNSYLHRRLKTLYN